MRSLVAWQHSVPRLFPDEYIYAALGRSIGHGHLQIRGATVHFPGILEPVLAAPIWRLFPIGTAYHLVQVENALAASLAAIPLYLLARSLRLSKSYSLFVAAYGLVIPELVLIAYTSSDAIAYPLAVGAVAMAVRSLQAPSRRGQVAFIALALLATLARVEYFALAPAYVIAAVVLDRRAAWRRHRLVLMAFVPIAALTTLSVFGYYLEGPGVPQHASYVHWFFIQLFLIAIELGVAIIPGALAGLLSSRTRSDLAFASFFGAFSVLLLIEATKPAAEKGGEFKERYLFVLIALAPIAYGIYVRNARPLRWVVIGVAAGLAIAVARLPVTGYATSSFKTDSQFLFAISDGQDRFGDANTSLVVAVLATLAAITAVIVVARGYSLIAPTIAIAVGLTATVVASHVDIRTTRYLRAQELPPDLSWVDHAANGHVTAIETPQARKQDLLYAMYWNTSVDREVLLGSALATDAFSAPHLHINKTGQLGQVQGEILFHNYGATAVFANAQKIASNVSFTLLRPKGLPRLRLLIEDRFFDHWLGQEGRIRVWPHTRGAAGRISFRLSLPRRWRRAVPRIRIGGATIAPRPGHDATVSCTSKRGPLDMKFTSKHGWVATDFRELSVRMTDIVVHDAPPRRATAPTCEVTG